MSLLIALAGCEPPNSAPREQQATSAPTSTAATTGERKTSDHTRPQTAADPAAAVPAADGKFTEQDFLALVLGDTPYLRPALEKLTARDDRAIIQMLIDLLEYYKEGAPPVVFEKLETMTGQHFGQDWFAWRQWQDFQTLPSHEAYILFKTILLQQHDPQYTSFIYPGLLHIVPLDQVRFGNVAKNSIIPLINPHHAPPSQAAEIADETPVIGLELNGAARAYPLLLLEIHQSVNDVLGGRPLNLNYCPTSGSPSCFDTDLGTSGVLALQALGLLRKGNSLYFDLLTQSVWPNLDNRPVIGYLTPRPIRLIRLPLARCSWGAWRRLHPDSTIVTPPELLPLPYPDDRPYAVYEKSPYARFPVGMTNNALPLKEWICGLEHHGARKAWPMALFKEQPVLNDAIGDLPVVLIGDPAELTVRVYQRGEQQFKLDVEGRLSDVQSGEVWQRSETALSAANGVGTNLARLPNFLCYWFAWQGLYPETQVYQSKEQ